MFRMKCYDQTNQSLHTADAPFPAQPAQSAAASFVATDFAWEFGWSFDGSDWLRRRESQPMQASSLDKALALAG